MLGLQSQLMNTRVVVIADNEVEQVICNAHTIHLAVCDVFYKKPKDDNDDNQESERDENENEASDAEKMMTMMMALSESVELNPQYKEIIGRVRKVCKMFKRSPVKKFRNSKASLSKI